MSLILHALQRGFADRCISRLEELAALGLDKVMIAAQFQLGATAEGVALRQLMEAEVLSRSSRSHERPPHARGS